MGEPAMSELSILHRRLRRLLRRRRWMRRGLVAATAGLVLLSVTAALFLADWLLEMSRLERMLAMAGAVLLSVLAVRRSVRQWLGKRETELDAALWVERQQQIDSELVAALQFESPQAAQWGSVELEQAVIGRAAAIGAKIDVMQGVSIRPLVRRGLWLAASVAAAAAGVWFFPQHAATFADRVLLGTNRYPTATKIDALRINGQSIALRDAQVRVKCPYGQPVDFEAECSGRLPLAGRAELRTRVGGTISLALEPGSAEHVYRGLLPRLVESVEYELYLGDARTDPGSLDVVPLPVIDLELVVTPPPYSGANAPPAVLGGLRQAAVLEGSQVELRIASDKPLRQATLMLDDQPFELTYREARAEVATGEAGGVSALQRRKHWTLATAGTPLEAVTNPVRYSIQVTDTDGLGLERPLSGVIRIKPDDPPRIVASAVTRHVLPAARPTILFEADDDHGLARVVVRPEVTRADGQVVATEVLPVFVHEESSALRTSIQESYRLDLAPLELAKGDQVKIVLEAADYRGSRQGKVAQTEPIVFEVTDEQGILAALSESDRESARQLQTMIDRQLDVGEEP